MIVAAPIHPATMADMHRILDDVLAVQLNLQSALVTVKIAEVAAEKTFTRRRC